MGRITQRCMMSFSERDQNFFAVDLFSFSAVAFEDNGIANFNVQWLY